MLKLIILNGKLQGSEFNLIEDMTIGGDAKCDINIIGPWANENKIEAHCTHSGNFVLTSKSKKPIIDLGGELISTLDVLPGLIFSIGEVGFSIQEGEAFQSASKTSKFSPLEFFKFNEDSANSVYALPKPIRFDYVRGALLNTSIDIHWHPYPMGAKSNLDHFVDEHINLDDDILALERSVESENPQTLIRPFISNFISINKKLISKPTIVKNGDLVEFSETAFYIRIK
jgi:hypothetical protein